MRDAIITGPTGAIGMALINELSSQGINVVAVCHRNSEKIKNIIQKENVKVVECNLEELYKLPEIVENKKLLNSEDIVFYHFAWSGTIGDARNDTYLQTRNIEYTLNAVDAATKIGCHTFIGAGSQAEYGRYEGKLNSYCPTFPENGYGISKLAAGKLSKIKCLQNGIKHIWTRILSVYGPYDGEKTLISTIISKILNNVSPDCTGGEQIWDYLYSEDAAVIFRLLAEKGIDGKTYVVGGGNSVPLKDYITATRDSICPNISINFGAVPYSDKQVMYLSADIEELQNDIGKIKFTKFDDGIVRTINWFRHRKEDEEKN